MNPKITALVRRVADIIAECNYAQRRMTVLKTAPDAYFATAGKAPDDYAEFLFLTSNALLHEPTASGRAHGRTVG